MFESAYCFVYYNTFLCRMHKRVINLITLLAHFWNYLILIVIVAFFPLPSVAIAVIFTDFFLPAFSALTFPDQDTVAYFVLLLVHFSFLLAPLDAVTLAFRLSVFPALTVFFPVILIFLTVPFMILILNVAFFPRTFFRGILVFFISESSLLTYYPYLQLLYFFNYTPALIFIQCICSHFIHIFHAYNNNKKTRTISFGRCISIQSKTDCPSLLFIRVFI